MIKFFLTFGVILFCVDSHAQEAATAIPFMNLLKYRKELLQLKGQQNDRCPMNLRVRISFRYVILKDGHNYDWLVSDYNYSAKERKLDQQWAASLEDSIKKEQSQIESQLHISNPSESPWISYTDKNLDRLSGYRFYPGFYAIENFTSYQVGGPKILWGQDRGFTFKVFFEFKRPQKDLTPNLYKEFSKKLSEAGFEGDSKIPILPGWIRFTWNNVIVHAPTIASAKIAERIGLDFFGNRLASYSRGIDVRNILNSRETTDWPHYLCSEDPTTLPKDVFDFVQNR